MLRLVGVVVGLVLAWLMGVGGAALALTPPPGPHAYAYDAHIAPIAVAADSLERGPPVYPAPSKFHTIVDPGSFHTSARHASTAITRSYTYSTHSTLASAA